MTLPELRSAFSRLLTALGYVQVDRRETMLLFANDSRFQLKISQDRYYKDAFTLSLVDARDGAEFAVWLLMRAVGDRRIPSIDGQSDFLIERFAELLASDPGWRDAYRALDEPA